MDKMWAGRTDGKTNGIADKLNSSIGVDKALYKYDIEGSIAHAKMLAFKNIISKDDCAKLVEGLTTILNDINNGSLEINESAEDIHMFIESVLTERFGDVGKKLHTARSRNDQVALDEKLYLREENKQIVSLLKDFISVIVDSAEKYKDTIMPGYTHLQRAQPITFGFHLLTYANMFLRDIDRLKDCYKRINVSPIGSCALAGTTYNTDRKYEADLMDFDGIYSNAMDGVSDRDSIVEMLSACSMIMMHLSRFSEEILLWTSWEYRFIELSDNFTTGSSIMPQKKNSDMAELVRGKTGRVYGNLIGFLTTMKGLPLAYNKDLQEDKEFIFDSIDTVKLCLEVFAPMISEMKVNKDKMEKASLEGFINATDLADYLVKKGMPFRTAYKLVGQIVSKCVAEGKTLDSLSIKQYKEIDDIFEEDLYDAISLINCVNNRVSEGGTSVVQVEKQIKNVKHLLNNV